MSQKVPRVVGSVDVRQFKLDPMDGFLLTRIDGKLGAKDLARETGLPDFSVERAIDKLIKLGVVELVEPGATLPPKRADAAAAMPVFTGALSSPKYDPKELEEECDLPLDLRKRVLDLYYRLDDLDHWTLLGLTRDANKKTIKRAYFGFASMMHPDRFFQKDLGSFKQKIEVLFTRITEAHDTLVDPDRRADYETYLNEVVTTRGMEALLERAIAEQAAAAGHDGYDAATHDLPPTSPSAPKEVDLQARRQAMAKRLLGGGPMRAKAPSSPGEKPSPHAYASSADAVEALRRRYEDRLEQVTVQQARRHLESAEEALAKGDLVAAAGAFGIAAKFSPNDAGLAARAQQVRRQADVAMCESYRKQAVYEEKQDHWAEAARNWQKVARIKVTEAEAHASAAHALMKAEGDMHEASEHAKQAITYEPSNVKHHVRLAEIYVRAGLAASARRAAEAGLQLDASNAALLDILKKTK